MKIELSSSELQDFEQRVREWADTWVNTVQTRAAVAMGEAGPYKTFHCHPDFLKIIGEVNLALPFPRLTP